MTFLQKLDLSFNQLENLKGLETLTLLTDLVLHGNRIQKIHAGLL